MAHISIFLSTVSAEFHSYRDALRHDLDRPNLTVKVQEDFIATGEETLDKLDDYIRQCNAVVHLVGDMTGALAQPPSVEVIRQRYPDFAARVPVLERFLEPGGPALSYTQWEAWLAIYHRKVLIIAAPQDGAPRDEGYRLADEQRSAQQEHLERLTRVERYPEIHFANADRLAVELLRSKLNDILPPLQIASTTLDRLREVASSLLEVGRVDWKVPRFVAPLHLEAKEGEADNEPHLTGITELTEAICSGVNVVLFGEGGIGKTTFLLDLIGTVLGEACHRIPLYIDAAYWARTNNDILAYIANSPAAQRHGVTVSELVKLADSGCLTLAVNGWNEIPNAQKLSCLGRFRQLSVTIPALNAVAVTRSVEDAPTLNAGKQVHVRGLTWQGQSKVIRSGLDEAPASALIELLARDTRLRHAARSPLILTGLLAQAEKGEIAWSSTFDLLGAAVDAFEEDEQRRLALEEAPLRGQHRHFLAALAYHLTSKQETVSSRQEVLPVISASAKQLVDREQLSSLPEPSDILDVLSSHHLLHNDGQVVRFAHQRFQDYFIASRLLSTFIDGGEHGIALLSEAINSPFWEDALRLVCGKLKGVGSYSQARSRLIRTALGVDLGFACDLAGACGLSEADDGDLCSDLIAHVNALCDSPLPEVANYGVVCLIASDFTAFADRLWPLIESDNDQIRLNTYRLNGGGISLKQLGESAEVRIAAWSAERRAELMHEMANNPDNYDLLVRAANEAIEVQVRAAAISALAWNFPTSEAALQAWAEAPEEVQIEHDAMGVVEFALEQGVGSDAVRERLKTLVREHMAVKSPLRLVLAFPDEVGSDAVETVLDRLRQIDLDGDDAPLVVYAMKHAPDRLRALARELVLSARVVPDWASKYIQQECADDRAEIFEAAWAILYGENPQTLSAKAIGPMASREQTLRSVQVWLEQQRDHRSDLPKIEIEREQQLGYLLANAPGEDLLSVVLELGESASYTEAFQMLDLLLRRIRRDDGRLPEMPEWLPSPQAVRALIATLGKLSDVAAVPQYKVQVLLCCIAGHVAPAEFGEFLLEGCRLHLDAWERYYAVLNEWFKAPSGHRPNNPYFSSYLISAVGNWGFEALPRILALLPHPQANQLIPQAINRIVSKPWADRKKGPFRSIETDFKEGEQRRLAGRVLRQPDDTYQGITDAAARALGDKLTEQIHQWRTEQAADTTEWNEKHAAYSVGSLMIALANTPSPEIYEPLMYALVNGPIDIYGVIGVLKGLARQGVFIEDAEVVARLEALYAEETKAKWFDNSKQHVLSELCQIMFIVRPMSLLSKPVSDYLVEWQRFAHINEVIRHLGAMPSEISWRCLLQIGKTSATNGRLPDDLVLVLASALDTEHFAEFLSLIADKTWFTWCQSDWVLERMAPHVIRVIGDDAACLDAFLDACEHARSPLADGLACAVLSLIPDGDDIRLRYGLPALDAGKANDYRSPVYSMLKAMFTLHIPLGDAGYYEVHPQPCNELRRQLYIRAKGTGPNATPSRRLLADVECQRREAGRPTDEPRHPATGDDVAWTEALAIAD